MNMSRSTSAIDELDLFDGHPAFYYFMASKFIHAASRLHKVSGLYELVKNDLNLNILFDSNELNKLLPKLRGFNLGWSIS